MSGVLTDSSILAGAAGVVSGYDIDNSCRFQDSDPAFLYEVMNGAGSSELIWTLSFWTKISRFALGSTASSYPAGYRRFAATKKTGSAVNMEMGFRPNDNFVWYFWIDGSNHYGIETTPKYRDPAAWYHFTVIYNAPDSTAADRMQVWVNGERQTTTAYALGNPPNDKSTGWTSNGWTRMFGGSVANPDTPTVQYPFPGYMSEVHCVDGQALAPSNFAETDEDTNQWKAIEYAGTYGNNGFFFEFKSSGALGTDTSGSGNNFTSSGLTATDQMIDTPQNSTGGNFSTLNPLDDNGITLSQGNLEALGATNPWSEVRSTLGVLSGKWYWEVLYVSTAETEGWTAGIRSSDGKLAQFHWYSGSWSAATNGYNYGLLDSGAKVTGGSYTASFTSALSANDIVGFALDLDSGTTTLDVYVNNVSKGTMYSSLQTGETWTPALCLIDPAGSTSVAGMNLGSDSSFAGRKTAQNNKDGNNNGDLYYTPPAGYLALCTNNLADPSIALPGEHFNTVLYTGNGGGSTDAITGVGFQPEMLWIKDYDATRDHYLVDSVRGTGASQGLLPNTHAVQDSAQRIMSLDSDGFTTSATLYTYVNASSNYVSWNWKAGGAPTATNSAGAGNVPTAGSVKINGSNSGATLAGTTPVLKLSANTTNGFSMGTYTGDGSGATLAHGLSQGPELVVVKCYDGATYNWTVGWTPVGAWTDYMHWDTDAGIVDDAAFWQDTAPSASVITIGANGNLSANGDDFIFYAWHSVEGYSKVGSYMGNANADGAFVYTGFRPAYLWLKAQNTWANGHWHVFDNKRYPYNATSNTTTTGIVIDEGANTGGGGGEGAGPIDILSNGFKLRNNNGNSNDGSSHFLYLAIAKSPFKTSRAR